MSSDGFAGMTYDPKATNLVAVGALQGVRHQAPQMLRTGQVVQQKAPQPYSSAHLSLFDAILMLVLAVLGFTFLIAVPIWATWNLIALVLGAKHLPFLKVWGGTFVIFTAWKIFFPAK